jgi:hypothetical protein
MRGLLAKVQGEQNHRFGTSTLTYEMALSLIISSESKGSLVWRLLEEKEEELLGK